MLADAAALKVRGKSPSAAAGSGGAVPVRIRAAQRRGKGNR
jgi:hypothetical protein